MTSDPAPTPTDNEPLEGSPSEIIDQLRTKLAGHDEGLDRWCNYQDRLVEALDRLGLRQQVLAELERDGWRNLPECAHKAELRGVRVVLHEALRAGVSPQPEITRDEAIDALNQSIVEQGYGGTDIDPGDLIDALLEAAGGAPRLSGLAKLIADKRTEIDAWEKENGVRLDGPIHLDLQPEITRQQMDALLDITADAIAYIDTFKHTRPDRGVVASQFSERLRALLADGATPAGPEDEP